MCENYSQVCSHRKLNTAGAVYNVAAYKKKKKKEVILLNIWHSIVPSD